ncbi:hypothetical protein, partial [Dokdonella sp.]|uniref:DUF7507 domain-containing protein n=1 Tax=Dokdonella sp. TaxID=2291710 RepID=UPI003783F70F
MFMVGAPDAHAQAQRGFANLGFELPSAGASSCSFQIDAGQVPGWETTHPSAGGNACAPNIAATTGPLIEIWSNNFNGIAARQGTQFAELNAQQASRLYQNVCMVTGETVSWTFSHRGRQSATTGDVTEFRIGNTAGTNRVVQALDSNDGNPGAATCFANDGSVTAGTCARVTTAGWGDYSGSFVWTGAAGVQRIGFEAISSAGGDNSFGNFIDNVQVVLKPFVELAGNSSLTEGGVLTPPQIRVVGTVPAGGMNVQVVLTGTATLNSDYTTASGTTTVTVAVPAGFYDGTTAASQFDVPISSIVDDAVIENNETVLMTVQPSASYLIASTAACGGVPSTTATLTIVDNDIDLRTTKAVNNPTPALGSTVQYTVTYSNNTARPTVAPLTAHDALAAVADAVPAGLAFTSWTCTASNGASCPGGAVNGTTSGSGAISGNASLPAGNAVAGGTVSYVINATVNACGSSILNTSTITDPAGFAEGTSVQAGFTSPAPGGAADNTATASILSPCPQLTVSKTASPNPFTVGQPASYAITVQNTGSSSTIGNIVIADTLPTGITLSSTSGANWSCTGTTVLGCTFTGTLAAGANTVLTLNVTVGSTATTGNNSATASGGGDGSCPAAARCTGTVTTPVTPSADIRSVKTGTASVGLGGALSYTVVVSNLGPSAANGTTFSDAVPAGVTSVAASCGTPTGGAACGTVNVAGNNVTSTITTLPSGGSVTFTITGTAPTSGTSVTNSATAQPPSGTTDPVPGNNTGTATTNLLQPQLTVTKTATPNPFIVGQAASYTITVANGGAGPTAGNITVSDTLPAGITLASATGANWSCIGTTALSCTYTGTIAAGGSTTLTLNVTVAASAANANNSATASGGGDPTCPAAARCTGTTTVPVNPSADIAVTKSVENATPNVGDDVTFTVTVTNNGPNNATGLAVLDALPSGLLYVSSTPSQGTYDNNTGLWTVGALVNGANATLDITATVLTPGSITNTATKSAGDQFDPNTGNNAGSASLNAQPSADLQLAKTVDNATPNLGTNVTYTVTVTIAGPNDATNVSVDDLLPMGLVYVSSTASQGIYDDNVGLWTIGSVAAGNSVTLQIVATVTLPGDITNTATVDADEHDPNTTNNTGGVTLNGQSADIQVLKGVDNANPIRGDQVTFTITATNNGPSAATGVALSDVLPAGLIFVSATPSQGAYNTGTGTWTVGNLAASGAGATATLTIVADVDTDSGFTNTASLSAIDQTDPNPGNNSASVVVTPIASADLAVVKTGPATATAGTNVSYTLAVTNNGPSPAAGVSLADPTPAGLTFVSATAPCAGGFPCALGTLAGGASVNVTVTFAVPANGSGSITNTATLSSTTSDPTPGNNSSSVTTTIASSANVSVVKTGPASATAGQNVVYTLAVHNAGPSDAANVSLADPTPAGLTFVSATAPCTGGFPCNLGTLANGATTNITVTYLVGAGVTGPIANTATVSSPTPDPTPADNASTVSTPVTTSADLAVVKTGPASATAGQNVVYTLAVTNNGTSNAANVSLADPTPAGLSFVSATAPCAGGFPCNLGTLGSGVGVSVTVTYAVGAGVTGSIANTATVSSTTPDPTPGNNSSTANTLVTTSADVQVVKTGPATATAGTSVSYALAVTNNGPSNAANVALADPTPAGLTFVSATAPCAGGFPCNLGTLGNGVGVSVTVTYAVGAGVTGPVTNAAAVSSTTIDPTPGNNTSSVTTTISASADVSVVKTGPANATAGQNVSYTLAVHNAGPSDAASVVLADPTPAGLTFVSATAPCAGGFPCNLGTLANGATTNINVTYLVGAGVTGSVINAAAVSSPTPDPATTNNSSSVTTTITTSADVQVVKTGPATATAGTNVSYTLAVTNNGPSNAANVALADPAPAGLTFVSATAPCAGGFPCNLGTLGNGVGLSVTVTYAVGAGVTGPITNTATVSSTTTDPTAGNNTSSVTTTVAASANVSVVKTGPAGATAGQNVSYTLAVTNNGPSNATNVSLADPTPAGLTFVSATAPCTGGFPCNLGTLANGAGVSVTVTYSVGAGVTGSITNAATVSSPTPDPTPSDNTSTVVTPVATSADIEAVKTGTASVGYGGALSYAVVVTNHGPSNANGTTFSDAVPAGITAVGASCGTPTGGAACGTVNVAGNNVTSTITTLPSGGSVTFTITGTAPTSGTSVTNTATANPPSGTTDPVPGNNTGTATTNLLQPQLTVTKTATPNPFVVGQAASYTITVSNTGAGPTAGNITVADTLPTGITLASATGANWSCTGTTALSCTFTGTIAAGANTVLTLNVNVGATATNGNNSAAASGGGDPTCPAAARCTGTVTTPVTPSADIRSVKTGTASVGLGGALSYTVVVSNLGPSA